MPIFTKVAEMQLQPKAKGWLEFDLSETVRNWAREKNGSNTGLLIQVVDNNGLSNTLLKVTDDALSVIWLFLCCEIGVLLWAPTLLFLFNLTLSLF